MNWLIAIPVSVIYAALVEYAAHRWVMHVPGLGKGQWWREHAVEHHGYGRNDVNIVLSAATVSLAASPLLLFCVVLGWSWATFVLLAAILYASLWSALHAAYHGVAECGAEHTGVFRRWMSHHMLHHKHPSKNFGTVFICTDSLFGTAVSRAAGAGVCDGNGESKSGAGSQNESSSPTAADHD